MERNGKDATQARKKIFGVSPTVFTLGIVSFLTDVSSEMLVPIVPQFLKFYLGATTQALGLIEGVAECVASLLRVWAGYLADKLGRPKALTVIGYGLSALSKPFYIISGSWSQVFAIRFADRFGKGIRSAPRDVLIADTTDSSERGRAFGFHRAMDTAGATMGPLVVLLLAWVVLGGHLPAHLGKGHRDVYKLVFIAAAVPAALGWLVLVLFVPERKKEAHEAKKPELKLSALDKRFKLFLAVVTLFSVGNSSDAFLVLRATDDPIKMNAWLFLLVYAMFNAISASVAFRSGILSDRIGRKPVVMVGWLIFAGVYMAMARITTQAGVWMAFAVYGAYYGMTDGVLKAYAVDLAPANLRGTAVGAYYTFTGAALLPASLMAGFLWKHVSPSATFYYGAATAAAAIIMLAFLPSEKPQRTANSEQTTMNSRQ